MINIEEKDKLKLSTKSIILKLILKTPPHFSHTPKCRLTHNLRGMIHYHLFYQQRFFLDHYLER